MNRSNTKHNQSTGIKGIIIRVLTHGSSLSPSRRRLLYLAILIITLMIIWVPVTLFILLLPTSYTSKWDLILPGAGSGHAVSLESVGQASATAASPYMSHSIDPKVNYKAIAESTPVLAAAAEILDMSAEDFGKPRIKLVDQTALMHFRVSADNAGMAYSMSQALYIALQEELERLRSDELVQKESAVSNMLAGYNESLQQAQQKILDYQTRSRVVSQEQFNELALNLERSRIKLADLKADLAAVKGNISSLRSNLGISIQDAAALHLLQQDALFQELAKKWSLAISMLQDHRSKWGSNHVEVITAEENYEKLTANILLRLKQLAPKSKLSTEKLIILADANAPLYTQIVDLDTKKRGLIEQIKKLENEIDNQAKQLDASTTDASTLEDLKRKHQVATAVLTTALAKLDIGKSDRFSSYPLVQLLAEPTLPEKADNLGRNLSLLGGLAGNVFVIVGLLLLWKRKPFLQKILKNA